MQIKRHWANLSLLGVAMIWGATFIVVKQATEDLPVFPFLAIRFFIAFLSLLPFVYQQRAAINSSSIVKGLGVGFFLFLAYGTQTIGLQYTTASNAGFITGLSIVLVPVLVALTTRKLPHNLTISGIFSATIGLALLSLGTSFRLNYGDLFVLFCAFFFALHIFLVGRYAPNENATILAAGQILAVSILSGIIWGILPQGELNFTPYAWFGILLTAIPATSIAFLVQTKMQQFTTPTQTALMLSAEPVFSAIFGFFIAGEILGTRGLIGAGLVLLGMLLAEISGTEETPGESK